MSVPLAVCAVLLLLPGVAPPRQTAWTIEYGLSGDDLQVRAATLRAAGYRPVCVSGYNQGEDNRFAGIWVKAPPVDWVLDYGLTTDRFDERTADLKAKGYRPVSLAGYDWRGLQRLTDVWVKADGPPWELEYGLTGEALSKVAARMSDRGYRPVALSTYVAGTFQRHAVVWQKGGDVTWQLRYGLSGSGLDDALRALSGQGYRPVAVSGVGVEESTVFCAAWEKRKGNWLLRTNLDGDALDALARTMQGAGYRPSWLSGYQTLAGVRFAVIWEK